MFPRIRNKILTLQDTAEARRGQDAVATTIGDGTMMRMQHSGLSRHSARPMVKAESEKLVGLWGKEAPDIARIFAFRAEAGLLQEPEPGFWKCVAKAIGHRVGLPDAPPSANTLLVI